MANEKNLKPFSERTESEQREIRVKGGIASGAARREKKSLREACQILLSSIPVLSEEDRKELINLGFDPDDANNQLTLVVSCFNQALKGDIRAMSLLAEWAGEKPAERLEIEASEEATSNFLQMLTESAKMVYGNEKDSTDKTV